MAQLITFDEAHGYVWDPTDGQYKEVTCPLCDGSRHIREGSWSAECYYCDGEGILLEACESCGGPLLKGESEICEDCEETEANR